jgi:invasion protein IalB
MRTTCLSGGWTFAAATLFSAFLTLSTGSTLAQAQGQPAPAAPAGQPTLLGQFGDWGAYTTMRAGKKVCYALARPAASQTVPPNRPRDPIYLFISTRPSENVRNEVSVVFGYSHKANTDATMEIGGTTFALFTQADSGWIKNTADEARMLDTMRKGSEAVVKGESGRGTKTTDRYSLRGLAQALDRAGQECR